MHVGNFKQSVSAPPEARLGRLSFVIPPRSSSRVLRSTNRNLLVLISAISSVDLVDVFLPIIQHIKAMCNLFPETCSKTSILKQEQSMSTTFEFQARLPRL